MKKIVALAIFSEKFEMNVVYFSEACALNSFSLDDFYTFTFLTFLLSLYANNLIHLFFVSIYKCVTMMTFYAQMCTKSHRNEVNIPNCALLVFKSGNIYLDELVYTG